MKRLFPIPNSETSRQLYNLASVLHDMGKFEQAEAMYLEVIEVEKISLGPDHPDRYYAMTGLGSMYRKIERWTEAEQYSSMALEHVVRTRGRRTLDTGYVMNNLAKVLALSDDPTQAEPLYREILDIYAEVLEPDSPYIASTAVGYSNFLARADRPAEALVQAEHALSVARKSLPEGHWLTTNAVHMIGFSQAKLGNVAAAEPNLRQSFVDLAAARPGHGSVITAGERLVDFYRSQNRYEEAEQYRLMLEQQRNLRAQQND